MKKKDTAKKPTKQVKRSEGMERRETGKVKENEGVM